MIQRTFKFVVCMWFILLSTSAMVAAVDLSKLPSVEYYQGKIATDYLPYGRKFRIVGSTKLASGDADIVQVFIIPHERNALVSPGMFNLNDHGQLVDRSGNIIFTAFQGKWERLDNDASTEFRIVVDKRLEFNTRYDVWFKFYHKFTLDNPIMENIVTAVYEKAKKKYSEEGYLSHNELEDFVNAFIKEKVDNISAEDKELGYLDYTDGGALIFKRGAAQSYSVVIPPGWVDVVGDLAASEQDLADAKEEFNEIKSKLITFSKTDGFKVLLEHLEQAKEANNVSYLKVHISRLEECVKSPQASSDCIEPFSPIIDGEEGTQHITIDDRKLLNSIDSEFEALKGFIEKVNDAKRELAVLSEHKKRIRLSIAEGFLETNPSRSVEQSMVSVADLESIRIGTTFGTAYTVLDPWREEREGDLFTYIGLKFFFAPVDKKLHQPYLSKKWYRRMSFFLGIVAGENISFKGQNLENAAGLKPLVGLSYDLTRYITLDVGALFFKQASISPESSEKTLRAAPFVGLSFDFDVINRIRPLIQPLD